MRLGLGHVASRMVPALSRFRIADHLALHRPADLARVTRTHERSLLRLLRTASALRLVREVANAGFASTPQMAERTAETQITFCGGEPDTIAAGFDFSAVRIVADVGGSTGNLLTTILARHAATRGILFDVPYAAAAGRTMVERRGLADRCEVLSGSFFDAVPAGADLYLLSHVLRDWPEKRCEENLRNVRRAIPSHGRLLVVEPLLTSGSDSDAATLLGVIALAITGGRIARSKNIASCSAATDSA